ncbi:MAG: 50S ribosomal protein L2 [bacterium]
MAIRKYKATTPSRRHASVVDTRELSKKRPEKRLISALKSNAGRNSQGKITVRHKGGRAKRFYRLVDFLQDRLDMPATIKSIEYDPNRSANIALIEYSDGVKSYILAPMDMKAGDTVVSSQKRVDIKNGNRMPLALIPTGLLVHNIELMPGNGGKIVRSAGLMATLLSVEGDNAQLKMPSGEIRLVPKMSRASIGQVGNTDHSNIRLGKAGRMRWRGVRPTVRGKAMNPVDHPHGGGEGVQPIGLKHPKTPWGKPALGVHTRRPKYSDRLILKRRKK